MIYWTMNTNGLIIFMVANVLLFWLVYAVAVRMCGKIFKLTFSFMAKGPCTSVIQEKDVHGHS